MADFIAKLGGRTVAGFANCTTGSPVLALDPGNRDWMAAPVHRGGGDLTCRRVGPTR
jgi:hypothetical protein